MYFYDTTLRPWRGPLIYLQEQGCAGFIKVLSGKLRVQEPMWESEKIHQIRVFQEGRFHTVSEAFTEDVADITGPRSSKAGQGLEDYYEGAVFTLQPALQAKVIYYISS